MDIKLINIINYVYIYFVGVYANDLYTYADYLTYWLYIFTFVYQQSFSCITTQMLNVVFLLLLSSPKTKLKQENISECGLMNFTVSSYLGI